jgi:hypothetical protein
MASGKCQRAEMSWRVRLHSKRRSSIPLLTGPLCSVFYFQLVGLVACGFWAVPEILCWPASIRASSESGYVVLGGLIASSHASQRQGAGSNALRLSGPGPR